MGDGTAAEASASGLIRSLAATLGKVAVFVALALVVGTRVVPWLLMQVMRTGSRELFTLAVLAVALGIAYGAATLFGVSFALGAFFAGVILSESDLSHKAGEDSLPLQDAFAVLFFVSVGMLFDPMILVREPLAVASVLLVIVAGKSVAAFIIVLAFGYPMRTALIVSASLAQIGEFSFILAGLGLSLGLLPPVGRDLILAGALLSIILNPLVFAGISVLERALVQRALRKRPRAREVVAIANHAVIVGHGRVGGAITPGLEENQLDFVVIERDRRLFEQLQSDSVPSVFGDATDQGVLEAAHIDTARLLVIALPDSYQARRILELARQVNPNIEAVVRTHSNSEFDYLTRNGAAYVVMGEREVARAMVEYVLRRLSTERPATIV